MVKLSKGSLIIIICIFVLDVTPQYTISPLDNSGVLFENIGKILFFKNEWRVFTTIKLNQLNTWNDYLSWSDDTITTLCDNYMKIDNQTTCARNVVNIRYLTAKAKAMLGRIQMKSLKRSKRSIFDGVGKLSKFLFGTMDQEDADTIHEKLENLQSNDKQNLESMKEQISVVESNYNDNREKFEKFNTDLNETKLYVNKFSKTVNNKLSKLTSNLNTLHIEFSIDEATTSLTVHIQEIEYQIHNLLMIISSLSDGHLHPLIFSYQQLADLLESLPIASDMNSNVINPYSLQQISSVKSTYVGETLLCKISIPIVLQDQFELRKIYILPMKTQHNFYVHYDIKAEYLAVNDGANKMILLKQFELSQCKKFGLNLTSETTVCSLTSPTYTSPENICILLLYRKWTESNKICTTLPTTQFSNTFIKLYSPNSWIYLLNQELSMNITCLNYNSIVKIANQGIITMQSNCLGQVKNLILPTTNKISKNISFEQAPLNFPLNESELYTRASLISDEKINNGELSFQNFHEHSATLKEKRQEFDKLIKKIELMEKDQEIRFHQTSSKALTIATGTTSSILVIIFVILFIVKCQKLKNKSEKRKAPVKPMKNLSENWTKCEYPLKLLSINVDRFSRSPFTNQDTQPKSKISDFEII